MRVKKEWEYSIYQYLYVVTELIPQLYNIDSLCIIYVQLVKYLER